MDFTPATFKFGNPLEDTNNALNTVLLMEKMTDNRAKRRRTEGRNSLMKTPGVMNDDGSINRGKVKLAARDNDLSDLIPEYEEQWAKDDLNVANARKHEAEVGQVQANISKTQADDAAKRLENIGKMLSLAQTPQQVVDFITKDPVIGASLADRNMGPEQLNAAFSKMDPAQFQQVKNQMMMGAKDAYDAEMQKVLEKGRNDRNAADNWVSVANNMRTTGVSASNNVRTNNTSAANNVRTTNVSAANNAANIASREGMQAKNIASRVELKQMGFNEERWKNDVKYADEMMTRGGLVSQILKKEFPWINVGTIGRRSMAEQQTLWERSGRDPFMAAKPGTSLHGLGAAIDYSHGMNISPEQIAKFHRRAAELGIQMYDETASKNGAHQHGTIVNPPDITTLRQMMKGNQSKLITNKNNLRVVDEPGVEVAKPGARRAPDFAARAIQSFERLHKDSGFLGTSADKAVQVERLKQWHKQNWEFDNGLSTTQPGPMPVDGGLIGDISAEDLARAYDFIQNERKRNSEIGKNQSWTERNMGK